MLRLFTRKNADSPSKPADNTVSADFGRLLNEHLGYIAKVCERAADNGHTPSQGQGQMIAGEDGYSYIVEQAGSLDADDLFVQVLDHLKEDNFRRLRDFQGRSSITTYLTSIITRFVIDVVRSRSGRSRAKERAVKLGVLGERVYDLMVLRNHSASEAAEIMQTTFGEQISPDELREIHAGLLGRETRHQSSAESTIAWGEDGELVAIQSATPERELSDRIQQKRRGELLAALMENLKVDDRLLLRLRFPLDDAAEPLEMSAIAAMVGLNEQQAERKLRKILVDCREELLKKGLSLNDLL
jgi:RNA polymerase sigma factor (sigma-70 family)